MLFSMMEARIPQTIPQSIVKKWLKTGFLTRFKVFR
jgi:hypothetical protein